MTSVYLIPILLRPIDFVQNIAKYIFGMLSYIFLMPTYSNVIQLYSMCNLHDVSWGNRPAQGQGLNALTSIESNQLKLKQDYMVFRAYILYLWLSLNVVYAFVMVYLS